MLVNLSISNFSLIEHLEVKLEKGFTVITGETGSGKSILFNALNLLLGQRADFSLIGQNSSKAIVEGEFLIDESYISFFLENDLDYSNNTIIRREINNQSRSRIFINDTPVSLTLIKEFSSKLIQIHSQYNTLQLNDVNYQLEILDVLSETEIEKRKYSEKFLDFKKLEKKIKSIKKNIDQKIKSIDYNSFILNELKLLNLETIDYNQIEIQLKKNENIEELLKVYNVTEKHLGNDGGVLDILENIKSQISLMLEYDDSLVEIHSRIDSVILELKDVEAQSISSFEELNGLQENDSELLIQQLDAYNKLLNKHRLNNQKELLHFQYEIEEKMNSIDEESLEFKNLTVLFNEKREMIIKNAKELHDLRLKSLPFVCSNIQNILKNLKLPHTKLDFNLKKINEPDINGCSEVDFLFSANINLVPVPIYKAASGGELSRLMLALQKMISEKKKLPTILFDEIDTGVSGDVAYKLGKLLSLMSNNVQIIAITHLPQVAAKAHQHFKVNKININNTASSNLTKLNDSERVEEIARLMSGEIISNAAIENAKNLILAK